MTAPTQRQRPEPDLHPAIVRAVKMCGFCDYPAAWAIQSTRGLIHLPRCSSVPGWHPLSGPGLLCDCGAVVSEFERIRGSEGL